MTEFYRFPCITHIHAASSVQHAFGNNLLSYICTKKLTWWYGSVFFEKEVVDLHTWKMKSCDHGKPHPKFVSSELVETKRIMFAITRKCLQSSSFILYNWNVFWFVHFISYWAVCSVHIFVYFLRFVCSTGIYSVSIPDNHFWILPSISFSF